MKIKLDQLDPKLTLKDLVRMAHRDGRELHVVLKPKDPGLAFKLFALLHAAKTWHEVL